MNGERWKGEGGTNEIGELEKQERGNIQRKSKKRGEIFRERVKRKVEYLEKE